MTLDLPNALSQRVMNALKADPRTVDLRALVPHFYSLAVRILELFEEEEMVEILTEVKTTAILSDQSMVDRRTTDIQEACSGNCRPCPQSTRSVG